MVATCHNICNSNFYTRFSGAQFSLKKFCQKSHCRNPGQQHSQVDVLMEPKGISFLLILCLCTTLLVFLFMAFSFSMGGQRFHGISSFMFRPILILDD